MGINSVKLVKGMCKDDVNKLVGEWVVFEDDEYINNSYAHQWKCKCGKVFKRTWGHMKGRSSIDCGCIKFKEREEKYKQKVEESGRFEYIKSYRKDETFIGDKRKVKRKVYVQARNKYCNHINITRLDEITKINYTCSKCCGSYENSFAYYIEQELGEPLEKYWDFEKNTVNPYHIWKSSNKHKVWIRCQEKDYHGSYEINCSRFASGCRCPFCKRAKCIHPLDSFGQYLKDNGMMHLWSHKNTIDAFSVSKHTYTKVWMLCDKKDYHNDKGGYLVSCDNFTKGNRCSYCNPSGDIPLVHPLDSFGYHNFDKVMSWHPDNNISPFRVAQNSGRKYKFVCETCGEKWSTTLYHISNGRWCPQCSSSKGEKRINKWLRLNNIKFIPQKTFDGLIGLGGGNLSYDFYLPDYNLLIEYQGEYHDGSTGHQTEEDIERRRKHDEFKKDYAQINNIGLLEIWYWDFDNIEEILDKCVSRR